MVSPSAVQYNNCSPVKTEKYTILLQPTNSIGRVQESFLDVLRSLKTIGLLHNKNDKPGTVLDKLDADYTEELQWLKNSSEPWRQVEEYWITEVTQSIGDLWVSSFKITVRLYFGKFPYLYVSEPRKMYERLQF